LDVVKAHATHEFVFAKCEGTPYHSTASSFDMLYQPAGLVVVATRALQYAFAGSRVRLALERQEPSLTWNPDWAFTAAMMTAHAMRKRGALELLTREKPPCAISAGSAQLITDRLR
jgi:hypothetical protein